MTIHHVELSWSKSGSSISTSDGRTFTFTLRQGYQVTHSIDATEGEIINATGIPILGNYYTGTIVPCMSKNREVISPIFSMVLCEFSLEVAGGEGGENPGPEVEPVNAPPVVEWSDETSNEPIDQDADGNPIQTVNGEKINGVTMDIADPVLIVQKNFANYNPHLIHAYRMATNSDTFYSFEPGTARLISAPAKLMGSGSNLYWQVTARFKFRYPYNTTSEKAWYARVLHEGFRVKDDDTDEIKHATDDAEPPNKVVTPVAIDLDGYKISADQTETESVWLEFKRYQTLPFNALGFS